jgi:Transglutaminase-like superfamily
VPPDDATRHFTIWLGGARVGTAIEHEHWTDTGLTLARTETLRFLRGDDEINLATTIVIDADTTLAARRVRWTETGSETRSAEATRTTDGWRLSTGETLAMAGVPAELVPLIVRRDGRFAGPIFLPARGFVVGTGRIDPVAPARLVARITLDAGPVVEATIDLDSDGSPARVIDGEGVIALRATAAQASAPFIAVDLIAATAVPIAGTRNTRMPRDTSHIVIDGDIALPALPGQRALPSQPATAGLAIELSSALRGELPAGEPMLDRGVEIHALVAAVRARITPSLTAGPTSSRDAPHATAGDCTTFALAYAALAASRGIDTRVVTGLRVDGDRLIRHRWAVSWTGARWIAIDAAFGHVPAGGNLIGLAVHTADDAGLVAGEAALTHVRAAAWSP